MCACFKDRLIFQLQAYEYVYRFKTKNDLIRFEFMATNLVVHLLMQEGHLMIYLFIHPLWGKTCNGMYARVPTNKSMAHVYKAHIHATHAKAYQSIGSLCGALLACM